jgi:hypothetical protein
MTSSRPMGGRLGETIEDLAERLSACSGDPLAFVRLCWPSVKLEHWQEEVLTEIADQLAENARLGRFTRGASPSVTQN